MIYAEDQLEETEFDGRSFDVEIKWSKPWHIRPESQLKFTAYIHCSWWYRTLPMYMHY